ncbi:MAG: hypothetical protein IKQ95_01060 [Synergistaceae bacterium]|nr:hypothetical protein [Synergistaceae bacterium]
MTREELQRLHRNIDELYGEYTRAETERIRLRATNETLRGMNEALRAEKESLMSEKNLLQADNESLQSEKERLQADNESLRKKIAERPEPSPQKAQTAQPQNIPVLYPAQDFIIETEYADNTGGPDEAGFWNRYIHAHGAMGVNDRYNFYIGYLYERRGWNVRYEDDKRIICSRQGQILAVTTEAARDVNHNAAYTLIGRAVHYKMYNPKYNVSALCITSHNVSEKARHILQNFGAGSKENFPFANFPYVKCKVYDDGRRIYYVPGNDGYKNTRIIPAKGDRFRKTVDEAQAEGFNPA